MRVDKTTVDSFDVDQKQWYRVGGIAALVLGVAYIIIVFLYAHVGAPPTGGEAWFKYLPGKTTVWWAILGLSVLTDFLFLPVALAVERSQQKRFPEEPDEEEGDEEDEGNLTDDEGDDDEEDDGGYSVRVCRLCQW